MGIKAKDFWKVLCENLNIRLFSGVPSMGLIPLYKNMNSKFLHYIPAVDEKAATNIINGAGLTGLKGAILLNHNKFELCLDTIKNFNLKYDIPLLFIVDGIRNINNFNNLNIVEFDLSNYREVIIEAINNTYSNNLITLLGIKDGEFFI